MKTTVSWESIIKKLGFDPREGLKYEPNGNDWAVDDSKPNPYSVLDEEESQFLEDNWFGPRARQSRVA